jgi:hypothetical protein
MAQAGYTPIILYHSTTAAAAPTAGNLNNGELALNIQDEKLYFKNAGGTVKLLASSAGAAGDVVGPASATDNAIVRFDGTTGKLVQNSVVTIADSTGDISGVGQLNATTLDATNIEVTNIKAKDGTASATIADSTGVMTIGSSVLTTADINGGTIDGTTQATGTINGSIAAGGTWTAAATWTLPAFTLGGTVTLNGKSFSGTCANGGTFTTIDINGGTIDATAIGGTTPAAGAFTSVTSTSASGILTRAAATQDGVELIGRAGGTTSLKVTFTPTTLTASRTLTLPDASGTILQSGTAVTVAQGGIGITSGTSGGVPYFSSTSAIASSAALAANALVIGGGAGAAPSTTTTGTGVLTALGVNTGSAGAFVVNGGALGTPSSGTVTNLTGTASININGTVGATTPSTGAFTTLSSTGNTTLGDASTDTVTVNGYMGVGGAGNAGYAVNVSSTALTGTTQVGVYADITGTSAATTSIRGGQFGARTAVAAFTVADAIGVGVQNAVKGAGSTITNAHGLYISDQTQGTNNYGITSLVSSGANKWNIYASGTAQNYFAGNVGIGVASPYKTLHVRAAASGATSTTSLAHLVVESSGDTGLNILTPNTSSGYITFGDPENGSVGRIQYEHTANYMAMFVNNSERMRIDSSGNVGIGTASAITKLDVNGTSLFRDTQYGYQPAPTATVTAPATLTAAQLLTQIIPIDGGAQNITMPTGSALDSGLPSSFPTNGAFDFTIINTDAGAQSLLVNTGVTIVGSAVINAVGGGSNGSSIFRLRKTGTATYVVYRLA